MISSMNKIIDGLYLGNFDAANNTSNLKKLGITHILTAASGLYPYNVEQFEWKQIQILDMPSQSIIEYLDNAVEFIKQGISKGGVLVHCFAGVSRSSSCVIAYLMSEHNKSYWDALYFTRSKRSIVCPNLGFAKQLQEYEQRLKKQKEQQLLKGSPIKEKDQETKASGGGGLYGGGPLLQQDTLSSLQKGKSMSPMKSSQFNEKYKLIEELKEEPKQSQFYSPSKSNQYKGIGIYADDSILQTQQQFSQLQLKQSFQKNGGTTENYDLKGPSSSFAYSKVDEGSETVNKIFDYHCYHCKTKLFTDKDVVKHEPQLISTSQFSQYSVVQQKVPSILASPEQTCSCFFIIEKDWIKQITMQRQGVITCPKKSCSINIGTYSYSGLKCRCGKNISPGFLIYYDRLIKL